MTPTLSVDAVQVMAIWLGERTSATSPVGTDGGVRSPVGVGVGVGELVGVGDAVGEVVGDGDAEALGDALGVGSPGGVTSPTMVQDRLHVSGVAPGTSWQDCTDGVDDSVAVRTGVATAMPAPPTITPTSSPTKPTA